MASTLVSFERVSPNSEVTTAYKNLWTAVQQAREMCEAKCISIVQDPKETNTQVVYALAGLRLTGFDDNQFQTFLSQAASRAGQFEYSSGGTHRVLRNMSLELGDLFRSSYSSRAAFRAPDAPAVVPRGGITPPVAPPVATGRAAAPQHRAPTCARGHRMAVQLLHVDAFCDDCKMPLAQYVPCWTCEPCDNDLCHSCCIRKFAPQVLAGGSAGPVPVPMPLAGITRQPQPVPALHDRAVLRGGPFGAGHREGVELQAKRGNVDVHAPA